MRGDTMADSGPVLIERRGGHFEVSQGGEVLLRVPLRLFERFEANSVFPLAWECPDLHPVRRFYWNPETLEFLLFGLDEQAVRSGDTFGPSGYRSFLQGFWSPAPPTLFLRPYWRPEDPYAPFDGPARRRSYGVQRRFLEVLGRLRPPDGWTTVLNAIAPYLDALGLGADGRTGEADDILELSLMPPLPLGEPTAAALLEALAVDQSGDCCPVVRRGALVGVHALGRIELDCAAALVAASGFDFREGPPYRH